MKKNVLNLNTREKRTMADTVDENENQDKPKKLPEKIVTFARQHGINLQDDPELLEIIENVNIDKDIPEEVYTLIAELILHIYKLRDQWSK